MRKAIPALAAVSALLFALPAVASAESWELHPGTVQFSTHSGATSLSTTAGDTMNCTGSTGHGQYTSTTTSTVTLTFTGCHGPSGSTCHSGATAGKIVTSTLTGHNVWANKHGAKTRAVLLTSPAAPEDFATFRCTIFGIGPTITFTGNGVIGEVELTTKCGEAGTEAHLNFEESKEGHQTITTLWNTAGTFDLTSGKGGTPSTASKKGTGTITFAEPATATC